MAKDTIDYASILGQSGLGFNAPLANANNYPNSRLKRGFDLLVCLFLLPLVLPVIAFLALLVFARDGKNPIFRHRRVGMQATEFDCYKIRSMHANAAEKLPELLLDPEVAAYWNAHFRLPDDPRVTRLGAFLRATCLDELPQIFNVIRGDMSIVGPRPVTQGELHLYAEVLPAYLSLRPGITGLWQVRERHGDGGFEARQRHDLEYWRTANIGLDFKTIMMTPVATFPMHEKRES